VTGLTELRERAGSILAEVEKAVVGKRGPLELILLALLSDGHVLLEDYPGLAKTLIARSFAQATALRFARIQFTPDLMPGDVTGSQIFDQRTTDFVFRPGPIFANLLLGDEINRAPPKTQAALLEAMQERQVTIENTTHLLEPPFLVLATQNPIEYEGTYPLPEAQLDRFIFKVLVPFPSESDLISIVERTTGAETQTARQVTTAAEIVEMQRLARSVPIAPHVTAFAVSILSATHPDQPRAPQLVREYVRYGGSPRGAQALVTAGKIFALLDGRSNVSADDIREAAMPALRHRLILNFEGEAEGITPEAVVRTILDAVQPASVE
jgi:MoxR-like ATPase